MICPLWKIEVPAPVPRVSTISTPLPAIAPKPCTSASFSTRTGLPQRLARVVCRSKPAHSSVPRLGAVNTRPSRTAPGNPTDTRSKAPSGATAASIAAMIVWGATGGAGVRVRTGLPMICPLPSSTANLMPVPPISTASVRRSSIGGAPLRAMRGDDSAAGTSPPIYLHSGNVLAWSRRIAMRPSRRALRALLRMRLSFDDIEKEPHPEEAAKRPSRRTHSAPTDCPILSDMMCLADRKVGMRIGPILCGVMVAATFAIAAPAYAASLPDPVAARLVPEAGSIVPGGTLWVDLHLDIAPGWHTYWRNPGDSGLPTEIAWTLPPGFGAGDIAWPAPERFVLGTIGNYGYSGAADLLVPITAPANLDPGSTAHLGANASWLVCSDICIPGEANLVLDLPVRATPTAPDPTVNALFAAVRQRLPQDAGFAPRFAVAGQMLRLTIPAEAFAGIDRPTASFFPFDGNLIDAAAEPEQEQRSDGIELSLTQLAGVAPSPPLKLANGLAGVLVLRGADGAERPYTIAALPAAAPASDGEAGIAWWQALL